VTQKRIKRDVSGWIVLDKPYDMTSTQAVGKVRWLFSAAKAGHAGTLDPLATGILPIALGEATKAVPFVQDGRKVYRFSLRWGIETNTDDAEGEVTDRSDIRPDAAVVEAILPRFRGSIAQIPPAFSAIMVNGERAYDLARAGETVTLEARTVEIDSIALISHGPETSEFEIVCGKGTYVRALARDMARALGTVGHVASLHRAAVGDFTDENAVTIAEIEALDPAERDALIRPVSAGLGALVEVPLRPEQAQAVRNGNPVLLTGARAPISLEAAWASLSGQAVATGVVEKGQFHPRRVFRA
jgi:tRNA pseudouridine55 synthase